MTTEEAVRHFGGRLDLARVLGIWPQTIYSWGEYPPMSKQYELQVKTGGALMAEPDGGGDGKSE